MKRYLLGLLMMTGIILPILVYAADNYRVFELKHRDANHLQKALLPLIGEEVGISVDGNRLLVRGPAASLQQLASMIKAMDRPVKQLQVKIYRGIAPDSAVNTGVNLQRWTTDAANNNVDTVVVTEGTPLAITADSLHLLSLARYRAIGEVKASDERWRQDHTVSGLIELKEGIQLILNLLSKDTVTADISIYRNASQKKENQPQPVTHTTHIQRSLPLNQWVSLAEQTAVEFRPSLTPNRQVVSTDKQGTEEQTVWIYVSPVK